MLFRFPRKPVPLKAQLSIVFKLFLFVGAIELVNTFTGRFLNQFGILPRTEFGLFGILFAPFIHGNSLHFAGNIAPLLLFSALMLEHGRLRYWLVSSGIVIIGGLGVWTFARSSIHIGASGLIFGYLGYLVAAGLVSKELKLLVIAVFVGFFYGGMLWGVLPTQDFISFESHLFGLLAGIVMALLVGSAKR